MYICMYARGQISISEMVSSSRDLATKLPDAILERGRKKGIRTYTLLLNPTYLPTYLPLHPRSI